MNGSHTPSERRTNAERSTTDASAGWREEYATQGVDAQLRADGGTTDALPTPGDEVRDREEGDRLVVVETHADTAAAEYEIAALEDATVAEVNDRWSADAPVVEAVYLEDAEGTLDGWRSVEDLRDAIAFNALRCYSFPADRLARVPGGERR